MLAMAERKVLTPFKSFQRFSKTLVPVKATQASTKQAKLALGHFLLTLALSQTSPVLLSSCCWQETVRESYFTDNQKARSCKRSPQSLLHTKRNQVHLRTHSKVQVLHTLFSSLRNFSTKLKFAKLKVKTQACSKTLMLTKHVLHMSSTCIQTCQCNSTTKLLQGSSRN